MVAVAMAAFQIHFQFFFCVLYDGIHEEVVHLLSVRGITLMMDNITELWRKSHAGHHFKPSRLPYVSFFFNDVLHFSGLQSPISVGFGRHLHLRLRHGQLHVCKYPIPILQLRQVFIRSFSYTSLLHSIINTVRAMTRSTIGRLICAVLCPWQPRSLQEHDVFLNTLRRFAKILVYSYFTTP